MLDKFLAEVKNLKNIFILFHPDADGLSAALILKETFKRINNQKAELIYPEKGQGAYTEDTIKKLNSLDIFALAVLDLGISNLKLERKIPLLYVDHHYIYETPEDSYYISSFNEKIPKPTSLLVYETASRLTDISDLLWLTAVGTIGDLGMDEPFGVFKDLPKDIHKKDLKEVQVLISSAKRASQYDVKTSLELLGKIKHPHQIISGEFPETAKLQEYRRQVNEEWKKNRHIHPEFKWKVALISFKSTYEIQGLLASMWAEQLKDYVVVAANFGYIEDKVFYVVRTKTNIDVIKFMQAVKPKDHLYPVVFGQKTSAGSCLDRDTWEKIVRKMGFKS